MIRVMASSVIDAPVETVWPLLRDFGAISQWLPGMSASALDNGADPDKVGATRRLTFQDGSRMRERLLALSDVDTAGTFAIIESELPIANYVSTIRLQRVTDGGRSYIAWSGEFDRRLTARARTTRTPLIGEAPCSWRTNPSSSRAPGRGSAWPPR